MDTALLIVNLLVTIAATAGALAPLVVPVVECLKLAARAIRPPGLKPELVPAVSCLVGLALSLAILAGQPGIDLRTSLVGGFLAGLVASKLWEAGSARFRPPIPRA